jgi:hypothetical protein
MKLVFSRNDLTRLPGVIAGLDVRRAAGDAAERAAAQATTRSQCRKARAREVMSSARTLAMSRGRGLRSLRLTTEPPRSQGDARLVIGVLLGFLAGLTVMYVLQRRVRARRRGGPQRVEDRLAEIAPEAEMTPEAEATPEDAGQELVGVMGSEQEHDGSGPTEAPAEAVAGRVEVPA